MNEYNKAILTVLDSYLPLVLNGDFKYYSKTDLIDFYGLFKDSILKEEYKTTKYSRWLGFIQGILIANGLLTVEEQRNFTRPLFKHLDIKNGEERN